MRLEWKVEEESCEGSHPEVEMRAIVVCLGEDFDHHWWWFFNHFPTGKDPNGSAATKEEAMRAAEEAFPSPQTYDLLVLDGAYSLREICRKADALRRLSRRLGITDPEPLHRALSSLARQDPTLQQIATERETKRSDQRIPPANPGLLAWIFQSEGN
jgi:hypothetical protein